MLFCKLTSPVTVNVCQVRNLYISETTIPIVPNAPKPLLIPRFLKGNHTPKTNKMTDTILPVWFIFGIFGLCCYLCYELFLIAENGVISSRVTRYLTLPLRRQDYYKIKARIFFEKFGVLLLTLVAMFHISFLGYRLPLSLWKRSLPELILTCCFLFFAAILIFAGYLFHDLYCLKHHH